MGGMGGGGMKAGEAAMEEVVLVGRGGSGGVEAHTAR